MPARPTPGTVGAAVRVGGVPIDLRNRVLVAGVVPAPRFGREAEVQAGVAAVRALGAELADVPEPARLAGAAARAGHPVAMRVRSLADVATASAAGAQLLMVTPAMASEIAASGGTQPAIVVVVDVLADLPAAQDAAAPLGAPLAFDSGRWAGAAATAREAAAVAGGCRVLRTVDVRRSRRVAEVMGAVLAARRTSAARPPAAVDGREVAT